MPANQTMMTHPREHERRPFDTAAWNKYHAAWINGDQAMAVSLAGTGGEVLVGINPKAPSSVTIADKATFNQGGTVEITGPTTNTGTLLVTGVATFQSAVAAQSHLTVAGNLGVGGNTTLGDAASDTTTISGPATLGSTVGVQGAATFDGNVTLGNAASDTVTVNGNAIFNEKVGIGQSTPLRALHVVADAQVPQTITTGSTADDVLVLDGAPVAGLNLVCPAATGIGVLTFSTPTTHERAAISWVESTGRLTAQTGAALVQWSSAGVRVGGAAGVGFYTTTPIGKPTVSGSRSGGAALTNLLGALANLGLISDATSA